jgi:diaminopimelate epimerase
MRYFKMNGCGNDFVIFDARGVGSLQLSPAQAQAIADRQNGIGCDQVISMERSVRGDVYMRIWNADGTEVSACGNASRCVASILVDEVGDRPVKIETAAGTLSAEKTTLGAIAVDMGSPLLKWEEVPIARPNDTVRIAYEMDVGVGAVKDPSGCNMGNPHVTFFVTKLEQLPIRLFGPRIEKDPFFPEGVNVGFAEVLNPHTLRLRVWERGAGLTKACGTGACAAVVNAARRGLTDRQARVILDGGELFIDWRESDDRVVMTGPVTLESVGELRPRAKAANG